MTLEILFCILFKESIAEYNCNYPTREQKILACLSDISLETDL